MSAVSTDGESVHLESVLLGPLDIRPDTVITFPAGLPGFVTLRDFALIETHRDELIWMQSLEDAEITFLVVDPFVLVSGFEVEIPPSDLAALGVSDQDATLLVLAVAQLQGGIPVSVNLQSPIVIERARRRGRQVVLPDSRYGMHHAITIA